MASRSIALLLAIAAFACPSVARADDSAQMNAYVAEVLSRNPSLHAETLQRDSYAHEADSITWPDPFVGVMVDNVPRNGVPPMPMVRYQVTQTIPWPGKIGFAQEAIEHQGEGAAADVDTRRLDLRLDAQRAYFALWLNSGRREINRSIRALVSTVSSAALGKYGAGGGSHNEVVRAQVEVSSLDVEYLNLQGERGSILAMINALRLRPSDAPMADPIEIATPADSISIASLNQHALAQRPELRHMRATEAESSAMAKLARRQPYPNVTASVWVSQMIVDMAPSPTMGGMLGITLPVFSGPGGKARGTAFDDRAASASERTVDLQSMIGAQVADAAIQVETAERVVDLTQHVVLPKAHESFDASLGAYGAGGIDMVSVLDAARALEKAELDLIDAKVRRGIAFARLERATGGRK